ncbi:MAG: TolC family protein [Bacteroidales bacterium]|nr:TolC family protein [Bacteroidales bacterium]
MKKLLLAIIVTTGIVTMVKGQNALLDEYIRQGIKVNHELEQQRIGYQIRLSEYHEARGMYLPGISINARYSRAGGGRTIALPMRDIFEGYSLLNNFVNPGITLVTPEAFRNEEFRFLRETEHETKISLAQPLFSTQLFYNIRIHREMSRADQKALEVSTRQLVTEIRNAYFSYLQSVELCSWLQEAKQLSDEFVRVNERLLENDKVTADALYRARAENSRTDQEIAESERDKQLARTYFNYLIGQSADSPILINDSIDIIQAFSTLDEVADAACSKREELGQIDILDEVADYSVRMSSANRLPTLFAAADYGFQGEDYRFTGEYDYFLASVVLRWDLFEGFQNREKLQQARLDRKRLENSRQDVLKRIEIEATDGWYGYRSATLAMETSVIEEAAMRKAFDIIKRKYENGQSALLEYTDARTQWSQSMMNRIIKKYDYYIAYFDLLRITAVENINPYYNSTLP